MNVVEAKHGFQQALVDHALFWAVDMCLSGYGELFW
jgi:hypothetical protein